MHLQQTKDSSRATGGPQYFFHNLTKHVKEFLRKRGACEVVLQTPYGIPSGSLAAVERNHQLEAKEEPIVGNVVHDRIRVQECIGEDTPERINKAAIKLSDGSVFTGVHHGDALENARAVHAHISDVEFTKLFAKSKDGFLTNKGRFVGRTAAYRIAVKGGQITPKEYADANQDLWGARMNGGESLGALTFNNARVDKRRH